MDFDSPRVGSGSPSVVFGASAEAVGVGVSVQLIQRLLQDGKYAVIDRSAVENLLRELKDEDRSELDAYGLAAKIGRQLGLDAIIVEAVTRYGPDDDVKGKGGGPLSSGTHRRKSKAFVEITVRVFNVSSGEVMAELKGEGESAHTGDVLIMTGRGLAKTPQEMLGTEFVDGLLNEATANAVNQVAEKLSLFAERIPARRIVIEGLVAEVSGNTLTLNVGKRSGMRVGDKVTILHDSSAGDSADRQEPEPVLEQVATVTEVAEDYATATFAGFNVQVGDGFKAVENPSALSH